MEYFAPVLTSNSHIWGFLTINGNYLMLKVTKAISFFKKSSVAFFLETDRPNII